MVEYSVTYAEGRFVAVGSAGRIITSSDGVEWFPSPSPSSGTLWRVTHTSFGFLALEVGTDAQLLMSPDGFCELHPPDLSGF